MALSKTQKAALTRARAAGNSGLDVVLDDDVCSYLVAVIVSDLRLARRFPELRGPIAPPFFSDRPLTELRLENLNFYALYERLIGLERDAEAYFMCLAKLHKARLKYERILQFQPLPTLEQVGPRGLLQYGKLSPTALAGLLLWRKWVFDIDNRAGQETGYLFEPIIAHAIGGVPFGSAKSPIRREGTGSGRQVDCVREEDKRAYEFKIRVTIAASGQGRWEQELSFPRDARLSGYTPVLVVLDGTPNPKLAELRRVFKDNGGEVFVGQSAWRHLQEEAGATMARFLQRYVRAPLESLLSEAPTRLPTLRLTVSDDQITFTIGDERLCVERAPRQELAEGEGELPDDVDEDMNP